MCRLKEGLAIKRIVCSLVLGAMLVLPTGVFAGTLTHTVASGESLFIIANKYKISVVDIKATNGLKSDVIYIGQTLKIPTSEISYVVQAGDSLYFISKKYGVSVDDIKKANNLTNDNIFVGQKLIIESESTEKWYTVQKGDTLYLIGKKYGITAQELMQYNGLKNTNLEIGQKLRVPASTSNINVSRSLSVQFSQDDIYWMAKAVYAEARGEVYKGQVAVANVLINRVKASSFPNTVKGVIFEPLAFSCVADGQIYLEPNATAYQAVKEAINGPDITNGALYYWNPATSTSKWIWSRKITGKIGNHVFGI